MKVKGHYPAWQEEEILQYLLNERHWGFFLEVDKIIETIFYGIDCDDIILKLLNDQKATELFNGSKVYLKNDMTFLIAQRRKKEFIDTLKQHHITI